MWVLSFSIFMHISRRLYKRVACTSKPHPDTKSKFKIWKLFKIRLDVSVNKIQFLWILFCNKLKWRPHLRLHLAKRSNNIFFVSMFALWPRVFYKRPSTIRLTQHINKIFNLVKYNFFHRFRTRTILVLYLWLSVPFKILNFSFFPKDSINLGFHERP